MVISASHNPWRDNGIKLFGGDGFKLPDALELAMEEEILRHVAEGLAPILRRWRRSKTIPRCAKTIYSS